MKELDVRLGLHREVGLQLRPFCEERDVAVQYVYLVPFLVHQGNAAPYGETADDGATAYGGQHRYHGEPCFLCQ